MQIKNITQIFFLSLTLCALSFLGTGSPAQAQQITDNEISMYTMNTQTAVKRIYRKYTYNGATVIDVVDKNDALIARLSASPSAAVVSPTTKRSNEKLPDCIQKVWNDYIARLRRKQ